LSQFSFNDGSERKALSLTVMIMTTITMNNDEDAGNNNGDNNGGNDGDDSNDGDLGCAFL